MESIHLGNVNPTVEKKRITIKKIMSQSNSLPVYFCDALLLIKPRAHSSSAYIFSVHWLNQHFFPSECQIQPQVKDSENCPCCQLYCFGCIPLKIHRVMFVGVEQCSSWREVGNGRCGWVRMKGRFGCCCCWGDLKGKTKTSDLACHTCSMCHFAFAS